MTFFTADGAIAYRPPSIRGKQSDPAGLIRELATVRAAIQQASAERDAARDIRTQE
jgi:hypothetical protein